jgi:NTE family protein
LLDGALVNPVHIGPMQQDPTDLTVVVDLGGPAQVLSVPHVSTPTAPDNSYHKRIGKFINARQLGRVTAEPRHSMLDVALASMQVMQDTIAQLRLAAYSPDVTIAIPRNAGSLFEFWRAEELIAMGRESAAQAFARHVALATTLPGRLQVP